MVLGILDDQPGAAELRQKLAGQRWRKVVCIAAHKAYIARVVRWRWWLQVD